MKNIAIIITLLVIGIASCKKNEITQAELIGTWTEIQPCIDSPRCLTLQFANNGRFYLSAPFTDTGTYSVANNSIELDNSIIAGPGATGSSTYQIILKGSDLTVEKLLKIPDSIGYTTYNLYLMKQ